MNQEPEDDQEVLDFNPFANKFDVQGLEVALSAFSTDPQLDAELTNQIQEQVYSSIQEAYDAIWEGDLQKLTNLPVESFLPLLLMKHLGSFAKNFEITEQHLEYGFDPEMAFAASRPISKKKQSMLKEIRSEFI